MTDKQEFIESIKTNEKTDTPRVYKVPTAEIDFDNYLPPPPLQRPFVLIFPSQEMINIVLLLSPLVFVVPP